MAAQSRYTIDLKEIARSIDRNLETITAALNDPQLRSDTKTTNELKGLQDALTKCRRDLHAKCCDTAMFCNFG